jgi:hypothetical protein
LHVEINKIFEQFRAIDADILFFGNHKNESPGMIFITSFASFSYLYLFFPLINLFIYLSFLLTFRKFHNRRVEESVGRSQAIESDGIGQFCLSHRTRY